MKQIGDSLRKNDYFDFFFLIEKWEEIVGPRVAKHTIPLKNEYKALVIICNHSVFAQQLSFLEKPILESIHKMFPKLRKNFNKLKFQYNPAFFEKKKAMLEKRIVKKDPPKVLEHKFSPARRKLEREAKELLKDLEDDEIKDSLINIYIQQNLDA